MIPWLAYSGSEPYKIVMLNRTYPAPPRDAFLYHFLYSSPWIMNAPRPCRSPNPRGLRGHARFLVWGRTKLSIQYIRIIVLQNGIIQAYIFVFRPKISRDKVLRAREVQNRRLLRPPFFPLPVYPFRVPISVLTPCLPRFSPQVFTSDHGDIFTVQVSKNPLPWQATDYKIGLWLFLVVIPLRKTLARPCRSSRSRI